MICKSCGHDERFHRDPSGKVMRCDVEVPTPPNFIYRIKDYPEGKPEFVLCGCENLQTEHSHDQSN
jgi:hypothetical protein